MRKPTKSHWVDCTWNDLDILDIQNGCLRLKYPNTEPSMRHLFADVPLQAALREMISDIRQRDKHCSLQLPRLLQYCTIDNIPLHKIINFLIRNIPTQRNILPPEQTCSLTEVKRICRLVMQRIGPAHTEETYEVALSQELYARRIAHVRQMPVNMTYNENISIPAGRIDVEIDHRFLLELKSGDFNIRHEQQLSRYVAAGRSNGKQLEWAMVVCFKPNGNVSFHGQKLN